MKYQVLHNNKSVTETNDFKTALLSYSSIMNDFQKLDMPTDFLEFSVQLNMFEENKFMKTTFVMDDID